MGRLFSTLIFFGNGIGSKSSRFKGLLIGLGASRRLSSAGLLKLKPPLKFYAKPFDASTGA